MWLSSKTKLANFFSFRTLKKIYCATFLNSLFQMIQLYLDVTIETERLLGNLSIPFRYIVSLHSSFISDANERTT
jgi:glutathionylspermidine synthase